MPDQHPFPDEMREIVESFVAETREILEGVHRDLLALERTDDPSELIARIFRGIHTVKGTSSFLEFDQLHALAHQFEEVLNHLRKGTLAFSPDFLDVLFEAFDAMAALLQQVIDREVRPLPLDDVFDGLAGLIPGDEARRQPTPPAISANPAAEPEPAETHSPAAVRVDVDRLDALLMLVGELAAARTRLFDTMHRIEAGQDSGANLRALRETGNSIDAITTSLRAAVLDMRLVRADHLFLPFPRLVRELARKLGKKASIECRGTDTELDRAVAEQLREPLLHLIRNAIDHGIETPEARRAAGKPEEGRITLRARSTARAVEISIEDDGAGIDPEVLRRHAAERELVDASGPSGQQEEDAYALIWKPGFTTTTTVTSVSGRGIGLDVVRTSVVQLGGTVDIQSDRGKGTRFTLRLPRTISIVPSHILRVSDRLIAVPVEVVHRITEKANPVPTGFRGDVQAPALHLAELLDESRTEPFNIEPEREAKSSGRILIRTEYGPVSVTCDGLVGREDLIVQSAQRESPGSTFLSGRAHLRDGRAVDILDADAVGQYVFLEERRTADADSN